MDAIATRDFSKKLTSSPGHAQSCNDVEKDPSNDDNGNRCPVSTGKSMQISFTNSTHDDDFQKAVANECKKFGIDDLESVDESFFDAAKKSFNDFFNSLASCGNKKKSENSRDVITGMGNALQKVGPATTIGMSVAKILASSFEIMCARIADAFDSSPDEAARTIFSGFCIASAGIRSAIPLMLECATKSDDLIAVAVFGITGAVMSCVYLATSAIATLLAAHQAVLNSPTTKEMAESIVADRNEVSKDVQQLAKVGIEKISRKLNTWKANVSSNFLALANQIFQTIGGAISIFSALAKVAPVLAIPFVSVISGSISLVANALETLQGVVDYVRLKDQLEALKQDNKNYHSDPKLLNEVQNLERLLGVSKVRIFKGLFNMLLSAGSIVLGIASTFFSTVMPILPVIAAVIASLSLLSVVILSVVSLQARKMNMTGNAGGQSMSVRSIDNESNDHSLTTSDDSDNDNDNKNHNNKDIFLRLDH